MPTIYDNFKKSNVTNTDGETYLDVLTNNWDKFVYTSNPKKIILNEIQANRLDILLFEENINVEYWDIILVLNNIKYANDLNAGDILYIPSSTDLENYYIEYIKDDSNDEDS